MSDEDGAETQDRSAMPGLSSAQAYCTLINFIIGVGLLNMPFAFVQAGLVVSVVMMGLVTLVGWLTTCWLLETNARALLLLRPPPSPHDGSALLPSSRPTALEITDYIGLFLGHRTRRAYELLVVFYFLGVLWAYATIYASSMATYVPLLGPTCNIYTDQGPQCHQVYYAHMGVYTVVVASVSLLDYAEQRFWQLGLTGLRFGTFGAMVGLTALAMVQAPLPGHDGGGPPFLAYRTLAHLPGVGLFLPTAVYSQMMQTATPSIAAAARHPRALPRVLLLAFLTTCLMYCTMGAVLAMYFGEAASPNASLNFLHFTAGLGDPAPAWLRALTTVIVLFPALDMLSVYPLNVLVVSNILSSALDGARCWRPGSGAVLVRFAVSVIPIAGACVVKDINPVLRWTGSLGIFLSYLMPSLLQWASRRRMGPCEPCVPHCNGLLVLMVMGLASAAIAVVVVQTVLHG